jgi:hypothetical protein
MKRKGADTIAGSKPKGQTPKPKKQRPAVSTSQGLLKTTPKSSKPLLSVVSPSSSSSPATRSRTAQKSGDALSSPSRGILTPSTDPIRKTALPKLYSLIHEWAEAGITADAYFGLKSKIQQLDVKPSVDEVLDDKVRM